MHIMLTARNFDEPTNKILIGLAVQPLIWGDTFGEVIGSFFGRHEFSVIGIGEINKKTVEGTIAVFLSSFFSLLLVYHCLVETDVQLFYLNPVITCFYHAIVSMIVEVAAPRSTDNFFLQTMGLYILLVSYKQQ